MKRFIKILCEEIYIIGGSELAIFHIPLNEVNAERIRSFVEKNVPEPRYLEYKQQLPGGTPSDKKEFLADITAMANTNCRDNIEQNNRRNTHGQIYH